MGLGPKPSKASHPNGTDVIRRQGALAPGESGEFDERIEMVRRIMQSLLNDAMQSSDHIKIDPREGIDYFAKVDEFEALLIKTALQITGGRQNEAAKLLNLIPSTLCTKMKKFKIRVGLAPGHGL